MHRFEDSIRGDVDAGAVPRPIIFLHIPKTAGTSFLLMLQNTFGDRRVHRIRTVDESIQQQIDDIISTEMDQISCLTGHLPLHLLKHHLEKFQLFTILRDPIDRVTSLFRFLRLKSADELTRLELQPEFSFRDFLESRHPELYSQTNNGMVRMLCGEANVFNAFDTAGLDRDGGSEPLEMATKNLELMDFGLTEEIGPTLELAQALWRVPYSLSEYRENRTLKDLGGYDVQEIHQVVARNTLDLALYNKAREIYLARRPEVLRASGTAWNPLAVFHSPLNTDVSLGDIPGRRGFYEFEDIGLCWLQEGQPAELYFVGSPGMRTMTLHVHTLFVDYPVSSTTIAINGNAIEFELSPSSPRWHWLRIKQFEVRDGINKLEVVAPLFVAVKSVYPDTEDARRLGLAMSHVNLGD